MAGEEMLRKAVQFLWTRHCSSTPEIPALYSFLQPSVFLPRKSAPSSRHEDPTLLRPTLNIDERKSLESALQTSLASENTDEAWKSFKAFTRYSSFPNMLLTKSLIIHLSSLNEIHNLKRAFASVVFLVEKSPELLDFETIQALLKAMNASNSPAPAFALIRCMLKNRYFMPFSFWGGLLVEISQRSGSFLPFLQIFKEVCRVVLEVKLDGMKPDIEACNAALQGCCQELESVSDSNEVVEFMSVLNVPPNEKTLGLLAYLYSLKGLEQKVIELEILIKGLGFNDKSDFLRNLVNGYVNSGNLKSLTGCVLRGLKEDGSLLDKDTYCAMVNGFLQHGKISDLASLIIESQKLETSEVEACSSVGFGIINACINLNFVDKAHSILEEMDNSGEFVGIGVYLPILKAYCKEGRTAEATQLVMDFSNSHLQLDAGSYDELIEASMACQDFRSAFSLFRKMRETGLNNLMGSYLTVMTGLTESHRPELMAAFLDEVVDDPRIEVGTHDWNSIIHGFCKAGRLEDARRTFRRMSFLQFEPNEQTYMSLINGYASLEQYFSILILWNEFKKKILMEGERGIKFDNGLVDAFLYTMIKGGYFDAVMQVVDKSLEMKIFVDKWRYKQAFMETRKKLRVSKLRRRNTRKMEALIAFKNWVGLNA